MSQSRLTSGKANKREARKQENSPKPPTHRETRQAHPSKKPSHANKPNQNHKRGGTKNPNQDNGQRGRQARPTTARARGEAGKRRPANKTERTPGKAAEAGRRKQHKPRWARTALAVFKGDSGSPEGEYLSAAARGTWTTPTAWWRGQSPTQGRSLCCHEAEGRHEPIATTRHAKGMTTGPSQIQPDIRREGPARLTGPESTRRQPRGEGRGGSQERAGHTASTQAARTGKRGGNNHAKTKEQQKQKGRALQPQEETHTRSTQAKANQKTHPRQARDARPKGTDPNTPHKRMQTIIREDEHTCPVCGQTHPHSMLKLKLGLWKFKQSCNALVYLRASTQWSV